MLALFCSLALHCALLLGATNWMRKKPATPPPQTPSILLARMTIATPPQPQLMLPDTAESPPAATRSPPPPKTPKTSAPPSPSVILADSAQQQLRNMDFYPLEAIQNGWQGEAWVQIFLDEEGNVIAARLEASSGYPLLDAAAVNAARRLKSLTHAGLDSTILSVRFQLE
jgi:protein TonB